MNELLKLKNIGKILAARLEEIGVHTRQDLEAMGSTTAHRTIQQNYPETNLPVCYYLYSLEGALQNIDWREFTPEQKRSMRLAAGLAD